MADFPNQVQGAQAPAVEGDFSDGNPRAYVTAGPGGLVAGPGGVVVARFGWLLKTALDQDDAPQQVTTAGGSGPVAGFLHRQQQALITAYLGTASMTVPAGFAIALLSEGGVWVVNRGSANAKVGDSVYAYFADGSAGFASDGGSFTGSIAPASFNVTATIVDNVLDVSAVADGTVVNGAILTGSSVISGTKVTGQLNGTPGGVGNYTVDPALQAVVSEAIEGTYGVVTQTGNVSGTLGVGDSLTASANVTVPTTVTQILTPTTAAVTPSQTTAAETILFGTNVKTKFVAASAGATGALVKITSHLQG